jgi:TolA-binding protein
MGITKQCVLILAIISYYPIFAVPVNNMVLEQKVVEHSEQIDGMRSIVDGLNEKVNQLSSANEMLKQDADRNRELLFELRERIDKINQNYVTKDELTKIQTKPTITPKNDKVKTEVIDSNKIKTKENYFKDGLSQYKAKKYDEAKLNFKQSAIMKYNDALSYYYLGECSYYLKSYNEAVGYYKKSVSINDKGTYMEVLLLHTAVSLENIKEIRQAKLFYEMVIDKYPTSNSATIAKKKLSTLK